jgi:hypothetical protein
MSNSIRKSLPEFENRVNVSEIVNEDNGEVSYLTQSQSFYEVKNSLGATMLNTVESKHALFLLNKEGAVVKKCYMCKSLHGKTPAQIAEQKHSLIFFESYNAETKSWVPCISVGNPATDLNATAVAI